MSTNYDVIVVGQGVMGLASTYALTQKGLKVLGLDQYSLIHQKGSSHGETRAIRMAYFEHANYIPLLQLAYKLWEDLEKASGAKLFNKCGLGFYTDPQTSVIYKGVKKSSALYKIPIEEFSYKEAKKRFPYFSAPENFHLLYEANAGFIHVEKSLEVFAKKSKEAGSEIHENERVLSWKEDKRIEVTTDKGKYECAKLIFTGGGWSSELLKDFILPLQIHRAIQFWFAVKNPQAKKYPAYGFHLPKDFYYGFPSLDGKTIKVAAHFGVNRILRPEDKDISAAPPKELADITDFVRQCLPEVSDKCVRFSPCIYTMTPDENFILDFHPYSKNIVMGCGFSGHGFKFAPAIGEILADLAHSGKTKCPIDFLRLSRLHLQSVK